MASIFIVSNIELSRIEAPSLPNIDKQSTPGSDVEVGSKKATNVINNLVVNCIEAKETSSLKNLSFTKIQDTILIEDDTNTINDKKNSRPTDENSRKILKNPENTVEEDIDSIGKMLNP